MRDLKHYLHLLRNPWGHSEQDVRDARLWAADKIEYLMRVVPLCPSCGCIREHQPCNNASSITGCFDDFHLPAHTAAVAGNAGKEPFEAAPC